jgi:hypothetical protein
VTFGRLIDVRLVQELNAEVESVLIFAPPLTFVITFEFWNIAPNPVTGKPSNMSGITTAFGPVYPVNVTSVAVLVHVQLVASDGFCHAFVNKPAPARLASDTEERTLLPLPINVPSTPATDMLLIPPPPPPPVIVKAAPFVIGEPLIVALPFVRDARYLASLVATAPTCAAVMPVRPEPSPENPPSAVTDP